MLHRWKLAKEIRNIVLEKEILLYGNRDICQYYPISSILMRHADIKLTEMPILNTVPFQLNSHFELFTSTILRFHATENEILEFVVCGQKQLEILHGIVHYG